MVDIITAIAAAGELADRLVETKAERDKLRNALDQAWEAINLLGAPDTAVGSDPFERGYCQAIKDAMAEIEKLGGGNGGYHHVR